MKTKRFLVIFLLFILFGFLLGDRDSRQQPQKVMDVIGVKRGMVVGVAGAGKGYFTFHMSQRVGARGRIYANEISRSNLDYIERKCRQEKVTNITTVLGKIKDPLFPEGKMEMVFMCYVFHDLAQPVAFLKNIKKALKPGARVVILDQDPVKTGDDHFFTREVLLKKVSEAGFQEVRTETFLVQDNIYICSPNQSYYKGIKPKSSL